MDPVLLSAAAVAAFAPYLSKLGESAAEKIGEEVPESAGKLWRWVRDKLAGNPVAKASLEQTALQPEDETNQEMLKLALVQRLKAEPGLAEELLPLLPPEVQQSLTQTATASGGSGVAQVAGSGNTTTVNTRGG